MKLHAAICALRLTPKYGAIEMTQTVHIPWKAWYGDEQFALSFPADWNVKLCPIHDAPALTPDQIQAAFDNPIGTPRLSVLAQGKRNAVIVFDDISRPTKGEQILKFVLAELAQSGIGRDQVKIIFALGAHRPMMRDDIVKKLGEEVYHTVDVMNHYAYENLVDCGRSTIGTPIKINRYYCEADLKLSISCIEPHEWAGFGGGAKNILPGVAGIETLQSNHSMFSDSFQEMTGKIEGNPLRADIEDIARKVGLDAIVNIVTAASRETAGVFVGDMVAAHRTGVAFALEVFATEPLYNQDVAIFNAYPKDTEILQFSNSLNIASTAPKSIVRDGGYMVITTASVEGRGFHSLCGHGACLESRPEYMAKLFTGKQGILFSPGLSPKDAYTYLPADIPLFHHWEDVLGYIQEREKGALKVAVFPTGPLHLPK